MGPQGPQGLPGDSGGATTTLTKSDMPRIAFGSSSVALPGDASGATADEVLAVVVTPSGRVGDLAYVKVDASVHVQSQGDIGMRVWLTWDGSGDTSGTFSFRPVTYYGAMVPLTWGLTAPAGVPQTFRVHVSRVGVPLFAVTVSSAITVITTPFGPDGTRQRP